MLGHPGGEAHTRHMIGLAQMPPGSRWLDMGAGDGGTVRLLRDLGYCAQGIDLEPRGKDVLGGNYLESPWQDSFFDGIISQCSFYVSENVPDALKEAAIGDQQAERDRCIMQFYLSSYGTYAEAIGQLIEQQWSADPDAFDQALAQFPPEQRQLFGLVLGI